MYNLDQKVTVAVKRSAGRRVATEPIYSQCIQCSVSQSDIQSARQPSRSSQSAPSHMWALFARNHSSHGNVRPRQNQPRSMTLHTNIISSSQAVKGSCVSSQAGTNKCSRKNQQQLALKEAFYLEEILVIPHRWDNYPSGLCDGSSVSRCEPRWSSWENQTDHLEAVWEEAGAVRGHEASCFK